MGQEKSIHLFNTLIRLHNNRIENYEKAFKETEDIDLKTAFSSFRETSQKCIKNLVIEVWRMKGIETSGTTIACKLFRAGLNIKTIFTTNVRSCILESCVHAETTNVNKYLKIICHHLNFLTPDQQSTILNQHSLINSDYNKLKGLHDMLIEYTFFLREIKYRRR